MGFKRTIQAIDTHAGTPMRVITGGVPHIPGSTVQEKMRWLEANDDQLRQLVLREPRGYPAQGRASARPRLPPPGHPRQHLHRAAGRGGPHRRPGGGGADDQRHQLDLRHHDAGPRSRRPVHPRLHPGRHLGVSPGRGISRRAGLVGAEGSDRGRSGGGGKGAQCGRHTRPGRLEGYVGQSRAILRVAGRNAQGVSRSAQVWSRRPRREPRRCGHCRRRW